MRFLTRILSAMSSLGAVALSTSTSDVGPSSCRRIGGATGFYRKNDIIFCSKTKNHQANVVYFGGDVQDYPERMAAHRDNCQFHKWNLEATAELLSQRFPTAAIFIIRPSKMALGTFSVFENFVESSNVGTPTHTEDGFAFSHLYHLLQVPKTPPENENFCPSTTRDLPLILVGFSKGCVVLNQLLYELKKAKVDSDLQFFFRHITDMFWLDGGHSGETNTWVTDHSVLEALVDTNIKVHVDVTPYQVKDEMRRWKGKEEKQFVQTLRQLGVNVTRTLHFEDDERSLENHFRVLEVF